MAEEEDQSVQYSVLNNITPKERVELMGCSDQPLQVLEWINELISHLQPKLMTPPPVLSRVYQELSNGMLGFNQSLKLADVPFPFIFAQILEAMLTMFLIGAPVMVVVITGINV